MVKTMVRKCISESEMLRKGRKIDKERRKLWDKYFRKHPLTQPKKFPGSNDPKDKLKLLKKIREMDKLGKEWKRCGYGKHKDYVEQHTGEMKWKMKKKSRKR